MDVEKYLTGAWPESSVAAMLPSRGSLLEGLRDARTARLRLRLLGVALVTAMATAAITVGTALAGSGGGPFPH